MRSTTTSAQPSAAVVRAAAQLRSAASTGVPCQPVRTLIGDDVAAAYAVQRELSQARTQAGARITGRKVGLTSRTVQAQLGVDRPDFGVLMDDMQVNDSGTVETSRLLQPKIEAEAAFRLCKDLTAPALDRTQIEAAVGSVHAALEIVDSRIAGWDITFADTVADNASSGLYVLSPAAVPLGDVMPASVEMTLRRGDEVVSRGRGSDCMGDPLEALLWLARTLRDLGDPLTAGDVVLAGALGPMVAVREGDRFTAEISSLGSVSVSFDMRKDEK